MIKKDPHLELPSELSFKALLGLAEPEGLDGDVLRGIQARGLRQRTTLRVGLNLVCAIMAIFLYRGIAPVWALASWAALFSAFHLYSFHQFGTKWVWDRPQLNREDVHRLNGHSLITAAMWGSAFGFLGTSGTIMESLGLWSIVLGMMVYASLLLPTAPMAATIFISVTSLCAGLGFIYHGGYYLAVAAGGIGALLIMACLRSARAQVLFEVANGIVQEKSETVSLLLREFEDSGADWLWQTDTSRCATHVSPRFAYALGEDAKAIEGQPLLKLIAGDLWEQGRYPDALHDLADRLKRRESFSNLIVPVTIKEITRWWELSASPRTGEDGSFLGFRGVGSDVTEQRESADKISHLARFDTLTGLPNRLQLTETLADALTESEKWRRKCGFLMIDLDRFKAVNDTLGHPVGDRLLAQVARRLQLIMTDNELCGRLGGDEFAVVVKDIGDGKYLATLAKRIIDSLSRPYEVDQNTLFIGASVGSAMGPADGRTVELLMRSADLALYRSKDQGGNTHHGYQHKLHANAEDARTSQRRL